MTTTDQVICCKQVYVIESETTLCCHQYLEKIQQRVEEGQFYEAQQLIKTTYHRQRSKRKFEEAFNVLSEGAQLQLKHGQFTCGAELGVILVEAYENDNVEVDQLSIGRLLSICQAFQTPNTNNGNEADWQCAVEMAQQFMIQAIKWTQRYNSPYESRLHLIFAKYAISCLGWQGLGVAALHFAKSKQMKPFADGIKAAMQHSTEPFEQQYFIARGVLQVLAVGSTDSANLKIEHAEELIQCLRPLPSQPLVHFVELLLMVIKNKSVQMYERLKEVYDKLLDRDDSFQQYLKRIEYVYFNINSGSGLGGMFGDILKMMA
eukprot:TRINITY_DN14239_c0_g1_i10.p1 TRINITY_DN14239_c0_g1~~TRINITY_DN14239_c0_g1_i10.p1  ORF type:complete len:319 (-),score=22.47 TRINITY_DN14239_c0_g1_i10:87-1043(-)